MTITHGSLFTGIGGFELGFGRAGIETRWASEIEKYCNRVLAAKLPEVPNLGDITQIRNAATVDVVSFGSPCQDLSVAGRRAGFAGARSGLFFEAARVIDECQPAFAVWENVPGAFSSNAGRDLWAALDILVQLGARDVAWRVFDSQYAGVPQQRRRIYLVADFRGERAGEVLFDPEGCGGHPSPFSEAGQSLAGTLAAGAGRAGRPGGSHDTDLVHRTFSAGPTDPGTDSHVESVGGPAQGIRYALRSRASETSNGRNDQTFVLENARTVTSKWAKGAGGPAGDETQNLVPVPPPVIANCRGGFGWSQREDGLSPTLQSQDGSHQGAPDVTPYLIEPSYVIQDAREVESKEQNGLGVRDAEAGAYTLDTMGAQAIVMHPDAVNRDGVAKQDSPAAEGRKRKRNAGKGIREDGQSFTLNAGTPPVAFLPRHYTRGKDGAPRDIVPPLTADSDRGDGQALVFDERQITSAGNRSTVFTGSAIRRFTPLECERLQAFPDGWSCLCMPLEAWAEAPAWAMERCKCPDGPRYRAIGNAVTTTVPEWIGYRLAAAIEASR